MTGPHDNIDRAVAMLADWVRTSSAGSSGRLAGRLADLLGDARSVEECRRRAERSVMDVPGGYTALIAVVTEVQRLLAHPSLADGRHESLAEAHRAEALRKAGGTGARARIVSAPDLFVLCNDPSRIAALAALLDVVPGPGGASVTVERGSAPGEWVVHVVTHDRPALLARITDALRLQGLGIVTADLATWPDGVVLDSFVVRSGGRPDEGQLERLVSSHVDGARPEPAPGRHRTGLHVTADNGSRHDVTTLTVTGPDREGLLWRVATAFAQCGVQVHHARIETVDGTVNDRFEVTTASGEQVDDGTLARLRLLLR